MERKNQIYYRNEAEENEIDLSAVFAAVKKNLTVILLFAVMCAVLAYAATMLFVAPTYKTSFRVYVNNAVSSEGTTKVTSSDLTASRYLASTYAQIISGRSVLTGAAEKIGYSAGYGRLSNMVTVSSSTTSEIISVSVVAESPAVAVAYANAIIEVAEAQIANVVDGSSMRVIDSPYTPTGRYGPNYTKNAVIGFVLGAALLGGIVVIAALLDNRVKQEEGLEARYGIPVVGSVPNYEAASKSGDKYGYGSTKKKGGRE